MDGWMDGWMDACMHVCLLYVQPANQPYVHFGLGVADLCRV